MSLESNPKRVGSRREATSDFPRWSGEGRHPPRPKVSVLLCFLSAHRNNTGPTKFSTLLSGQNTNRVLPIPETVRPHGITAMAPCEGG